MLDKHLTEIDFKLQRFKDRDNEQISTPQSIKIGLNYHPVCIMFNKYLIILKIKDKCQDRYCTSYYGFIIYFHK